jgi:hypothetical protein
MPKKERDLILDRIEEMHKDLKELKEQIVPTLKVEMAVFNERTGHQAKIITGIGGLIAVATSTAVAFLIK